MLKIPLLLALLVFQAPQAPPVPVLSPPPQPAQMQALTLQMMQLDNRQRTLEQMVTRLSGQVEALEKAANARKK